MSIHHAGATGPRRTPWLPLPSLIDVVGHLALVVRYALQVRRAR